MKPVEIIVKSNCEEYEFSINKLIFPLNTLTNIINFFNTGGNIEKLQFNVKNERALAFNISRRFENIVLRKDLDFVKIKTLKKNSPYIVELIVHSSPYIITAISFIIENNEDDIVERIVEILEENDIYNNKDRETKRIIARSLVKSLKFVLQYVSITIN